MKCGIKVSSGYCLFTVSELPGLKYMDYGEPKQLSSTV